MEILKWMPNKPHQGRVFAAVFPHSDDYVINSCGLIAKLLFEGYRGYFIRITDDSMDSFDLPYGETSARIEKEVHALATFLGIEKVYSLNYNNHYLDESVLTELRHRLIMLFRFLRVDTVISFDPYGHYEENPDHVITGKAVEHAAWMAGRPSDLPESIDMGLSPCFVQERFYVARQEQNSNCVVDTAAAQELRKQALLFHQTPMDCMWKGYCKKVKPISYNEFIDQHFINIKQKPLFDLNHYETYRHIHSIGF